MLVPNDVLRPVNVVDEQIERLHALLQARLGAPPFGRRNHPWNDVHRPSPVDGVAVTVDRESDAQRLDLEFGGALPFAQRLGSQFVQMLDQMTRRRARPIGANEFIVEILLQVIAPLLRHVGSRS